MECVRWWYFLFFFFSSRRRHTRFDCDWSSDVCSSDLGSPHSPFDVLTRTPWIIFRTEPDLHFDGSDCSGEPILQRLNRDRKSTRLNSSHSQISYAVFCLKKKKEDASADAVRERLPSVR